MVARTEAEVARAKQAILQKVRWNGRALKHAGAALRADRELVLAAVAHEDDGDELGEWADPAGYVEPETKATSACGSCRMRRWPAGGDLARRRALARLRGRARGEREGDGRRGRARGRRGGALVHLRTRGSSLQPKL